MTLILLFHFISALNCYLSRITSRGFSGDQNNQAREDDHVKSQWASRQDPFMNDNKDPLKMTENLESRRLSGSPVVLPTGDTWNCTLGEECLLNVPGTDLAPTSKVLMILHEFSCGSGNAQFASLPGLFTASRTLFQKSTLVTYIFGVASSGATGALYRICWAQLPADFSDYITDIGTLALHGPLVGQNYPCTLTEPCDIFTTGYGLLSSNAVYVVAKEADCSSSFDITASVPGWTSPSRAQNIIPGLGGAYYSLGRTSGFYHPLDPHSFDLCWSHNPSDFYDRNLYIIKLGSIEVRGPHATDYFCTQGHNCTLTIKEILASSGSSPLQMKNRALLLDQSRITRGTPSNCMNIQLATPLAEVVGFQNITSPSFLDGNVGFKLGIPYSASIGYRVFVICWAYEAFDIRDFVGSAGYITMTGVLQNRNYSCTLGELCTLDIYGYGLNQSFNFIHIQEGSLCPSEHRPLKPTDWLGLSSPLSPLVTVSTSQLSLLGTGDLLMLSNYSFGLASVGSPSQAGFSVCWRHSNQTRWVSVGSFSMVGPNASLEFQNCTLGEWCLLQVKGVDLHLENGMMVSSSLACKNGTAPRLYNSSENGNPLGFPSISEDRTIANFTLGFPISGEPGLTSALCWTDKLNEYKTDLGYFKVHVGFFGLIGPFTGSLGCVVGVSCRLRVRGIGLHNRNKLRVVRDLGNTVCGLNAETPNIQGVNSIFDSDFHNPRVYDVGTPLNGQDQPYKICWGNDPGDDVTELKVELGSFFISRLVDVKVTNCTLGFNCTLEWTGPSLTPSDGFAVTTGDSCGATNMKAIRWPGAYNFVNPRNIKEIPGPAPPFDTRGGTLFFGMPRGGARPGDYHMCWNPSPTEPEDYSVNVGTFSLNGPDGDARNCTMGLSCSLDYVGRGLNGKSNRILVIDGPPEDCGRDAAASVSWYGLTNHPAKSTAQRLDLVGNFGIYSTNYDIGIPQSGWPRTDYSVCWSHNASHDYAYSEYRTFIGTLTLYGPRPGNWTCTLGLPCETILTGLGLALENEVLVSSLPCEGPNNHKNIAVWKGATNPVMPLRIAGNQTFFSLGEATEGPSGPTFICWTPERTRIGLEEHIVRVGYFNMEGPRPQITNCTLGTMCNPRLLGTKLKTTNKIMIVYGQTCGLSEPSLLVVEGLKNWTEVNATHLGEHEIEFQMGETIASNINGNSFSLCWGENPSSLLDYKTNVGPFYMHGPRYTQVTCYMGMSCNFTLKGSGFQPDNALGIITNGTCGNMSGFMVLGEWGGVTNPKRTAGYEIDSGLLEDRRGLYRFGTFETGISASGLELCWTANWTTIDELKVKSGRIDLLGPSTSEAGFNCTMGEPCNLTISGVFINTSHTVALANGSHCDFTDPSLGYVDFDYLKYPLYPSEWTWDNKNATYILGSLEFGRPSDDFSVCWGVDDTLSMQMFKAGALRIHGPYNFNNITCYLGVPCVMHIGGVGLEPSIGNGIRLVEIQSNCTSEIWPYYVKGLNPSPLYSNESSTYAVGTSMEPGSWKICWALNMTRVLNHPQYMIHAGQLFVDGPWIEQDFYCSSGRFCDLRLPGRGFSFSNRLVLLGNGGGCDTPSNRTNVTGIITNPLTPFDIRVLDYAGKVEDEAFAAGFANETSSTNKARLCWQADFENPESSYVDVGQLSILFPKQLVSNCTLGDFCRLSLQGDLVEGANLLGVGYSDCHKYIFNPVQPSITTGFFEFGINTDAVGGSFYQLCFAPGNIIPPPGLSTTPVLIGYMHVNGPFAIDFEITVGKPSNVTYPGYYGTLSLDEPRGAFGITPHPLCVKKFFSHFVSPRVNHSNPAHAILFEQYFATSGIYLVCWGFSSLTQYPIRVGTITVYGPNIGQNFKPKRANVTFSLSVYGAFLSSDTVGISDALMCPGNLTAPLDGMAGFKGQLFLLELTFRIPFPGEFALCWRNDFSEWVDGGKVIIRGPRRDHVFNVLANITEANLTLSGWAMTSLSSIAVIEGGICGKFPGILTSVPVLNSTSAPLVLNSSGIYPVCWCELFCHNYTMFTIPVGWVRVGGPFRLGFDTLAHSGVPFPMRLTGFFFHHDLSRLVLGCGNREAVFLPFLEVSSIHVLRFANLSYPYEGRHRICYQDFLGRRVDIGLLDTTGPAQTGEIYYGSSLAFFSIRIHGRGLKKDDSLLLTNPGDFCINPRGLSFLAQNTWDMDPGGTWSAFELSGVKGGVYQMCWWSSTFRTLQWQDVVVGEVVVVEPPHWPEPIFTRVHKGILVETELAQIPLNQEIRITREDCGVDGTHMHSKAVTPYLAPLGEIVYIIADSYVTRGKVGWVGPIMSAVGRYQICWCSGLPKPRGAIPCSDASDFINKIGEVVVEPVDPTSAAIPVPIVAVIDTLQYSRITIFFNTLIEPPEGQAIPLPCRLMLVALGLGNNPYCTFRESRILVWLDHTSTIMPGARILVVKDAIQSNNKVPNDEEYLNLVSSRPIMKTPFQVILDAPPTITKCDNYIVSAHRSTGHFGRDFRKEEWSVSLYSLDIILRNYSAETKVTDNGERNLSISEMIGISHTPLRLEFFSKLLTQNISANVSHITVSLTLTNFLNQSASSNVTSEFVIDQPLVRHSNPEGYRLASPTDSYNVDIRLVGVADTLERRLCMEEMYSNIIEIKNLPLEKPPPINAFYFPRPNRPLKISWKVYADGIEDMRTPLDLSSSEWRWWLPSNSLSYDEYVRFDASVEYDSVSYTPVQSSTYSFFVQMAKTPAPVLRVLSPLRVAAGCPVNLDGSGSQFTNQFSWSCYSLNFEQPARSCPIGATVATGNSGSIVFSSPGNYIISALGRSQHLQSQESVKIEVVHNSLFSFPSVKLIDYPSNYVSNNVDIVFSADVELSCRHSTIKSPFYRWFIIRAAAGIKSLGKYLLVAELEVQVLFPRVAAKCKKSCLNLLKVGDPYSGLLLMSISEIPHLEGLTEFPREADGIAYYKTPIFKISAPPRGGSLVVTPRKGGEALSTLFSFYQYGWLADPLVASPPLAPLEYSFSFDLGELRGWSSRPDIQGIRLPAGTWKVEGLARDLKGSVSSSWVELTVSENTVAASTEGHLQVIGSLLQEEDRVALLSFMFSLVKEPTFELSLMLDSLVQAIHLDEMTSQEVKRVAEAVRALCSASSATNFTSHSSLHCISVLHDNLDAAIGGNGALTLESLSSIAQSLSSLNEPSMISDRNVSFHIRRLVSRLADSALDAGFLDGEIHGNNVSIIISNGLNERKLSDDVSIQPGKQRKTEENEDEVSWVTFENHWLVPVDKIQGKSELDSETQFFPKRSLRTCEEYLIRALYKRNVFRYAPITFDNGVYLFNISKVWTVDRRRKCQWDSVWDSVFPQESHTLIFDIEYPQLELTDWESALSDFSNVQWDIRCASFKILSSSWNFGECETTIKEIQVFCLCPLAVAFEGVAISVRPYLASDTPVDERAEFASTVSYNFTYTELPPDRVLLMPPLVVLLILLSIISLYAVYHFDKSADSTKEMWRKCIFRRQSSMIPEHEMWSRMPFIARLFEHTPDWVTYRYWKDQWSEAETSDEELEQLSKESMPWPDRDASSDSSLGEYVEYRDSKLRQELKTDELPLPHVRKTVILNKVDQDLGFECNWDLSWGSIKNVIEGSAVSKAGIREGDRLLYIDSLVAEEKNAGYLEKRPITLTFESSVMSVAQAIGHPAVPLLEVEPSTAPPDELSLQITEEVESKSFEVTVKDKGPIGLKIDWDTGEVLKIREDSVLAEQGVNLRDRLIKVNGEAEVTPLMIATIRPLTLTFLPSDMNFKFYENEYESWENWYTQFDQESDRTDELDLEKECSTYPTPSCPSYEESEYVLTTKKKSVSEFMKNKPTLTGVPAVRTSGPGLLEIKSGVQFRKHKGGESLLNVLEDHCTSFIDGVGLTCRNSLSERGDLESAPVEKKRLSAERVPDLFISNQRHGKALFSEELKHRAEPLSSQREGLHPKKQLRKSIGAVEQKLGHESSSSTHPRPFFGGTSRIPGQVEEKENEGEISVSDSKSKSWFFSPFLKRAFKFESAHGAIPKIHSHFDLEGNLDPLELVQQVSRTPRSDARTAELVRHNPKTKRASLVLMGGAVRDDRTQWHHSYFIDYPEGGFWSLFGNMLKRGHPLLRSIHWNYSTRMVFLLFRIWSSLAMLCIWHVAISPQCTLPPGEYLQTVVVPQPDTLKPLLLLTATDKGSSGLISSIGSHGRKLTQVSVDHFLVNHGKRAELEHLIDSFNHVISEEKDLIVSNYSCCEENPPFFDFLKAQEGFKALVEERLRVDLGFERVSPEWNLGSSARALTETIATADIEKARSDKFRGARKLQGADVVHETCEETSFNFKEDILPLLVIDQGISRFLRWLFLEISKFRIWNLKKKKWANILEDRINLAIIFLTLFCGLFGSLSVIVVLNFSFETSFTTERLGFSALIMLLGWPAVALVETFLQAFLLNHFFPRSFALFPGSVKNLKKPGTDYERFITKERWVKKYREEKKKEFIATHKKNKEHILNARRKELAAMGAYGTLILRAARDREKAKRGDAQHDSLVETIEDRRHKKTSKITPLVTPRTPKRAPPRKLLNRSLTQFLKSQKKFELKAKKKIWKKRGKKDC